MNANKAYRLFKHYSKVLSRCLGGVEGNIAAPIAQLPATRSDIIVAHKILLAMVYAASGLDGNTVSKIKIAASQLPRFIETQHADRVNRVAGARQLDRQLRDEEERMLAAFQGQYQIEKQDLLQDIEAFMSELQTVKREDPLLMRKAYILLGVHFSPPRNQMSVAHWVAGLLFGPDW